MPSVQDDWDRDLTWVPPPPVHRWEQGLPPDAPRRLGVPWQWYTLGGGAALLAGTALAFRAGLAARLFARYQPALTSAAEQAALDLRRLRLRIEQESLVVARQRLLQAALGETNWLASDPDMARAISAATLEALDQFGWARVLRGHRPLGGAWRRSLTDRIQSLLQKQRPARMPAPSDIERTLQRLAPALRFPPRTIQDLPPSIRDLRDELWRQHQQRLVQWEAILQQHLLRTHAPRRARWMRPLGLSPITVGEALRLGLAGPTRTVRIVGLGGTQEQSLQRFLQDAARKVPGFAEMAFDPLVLRDPSGQVVDLRFLRSIEEHAYRIASSFRVPFLNFSLPQILRWDLLRGLRQRAGQVRVIPAGSLQMLEALSPEVRRRLRQAMQAGRGLSLREARRIWATPRTLVRVGSTLYDLERPGEPVATGVFGASPYSLLGQLTARLMGLHPRPQAAPGGLSGRMRRLLDLGFQPMPSIFAQVRSAIAKYWDPTSDLHLLEQIRASGVIDDEARAAAKRLLQMIRRARRPLPAQAMGPLEPYIERALVVPAVAGEAQDLLKHLQQTHPQLAAQLRHQLATAAPDLAPVLEMRAASDATLKRLLTAYQTARERTWRTLRMETDEDVLRLFEVLGAENVRHPWRTPSFEQSPLAQQIAREWRAYVYEPQGFLESRRVITRRIPQIAAVGEFLPQDIEEISRLEDVKALLQHAILRAVEPRLPPSVTTPTPLLAFTPSLPSSARPAWRLAVLDYWATQAGATLDQQATFLADAILHLPENSSALQELRNLIRQEVPWYAAARYTPPPERLLTEGQWVTPELLIRQAFRPPSVREHLAALGGDPAAAARVRAGWSAFFRQFVAGRESPQYVTTATLVPYFFMSRINEALAFFGLGLSPAWTGSAARIWGGLTLLRWLPAIALPFYAGYLDWEIENRTGFSPKKAIARSLAGLHILSAKARDLLGITSLAKELAPLFPGSELIWEIPGLSFFDPTKSAEEVAYEYEHGRFPIRRGRWWLLSSSPIQGERIETFAPSWLKQIESDYYIRGVYGSRETYYAYGPFPVPRYPLNWLRRLFTDPYWLERMQYYERPYPVTGPIPELHEIPIIGPLVSGTVGRLLKPPRRMHVAEVEQWMRLAALYEQGLLSPEPGQEPAGAGSPVAYAYITPAGLVSIRQARGERGHALEEAPAFINQIPVRTPRGQLYPLAIQGAASGPSTSGYGLAPGPASARAQARAVAYGTGTAAGAPTGDLTSEKAQLVPVRLVQEVSYEELAAAELARRAQDPHSLHSLAAESLYRATEWAGLYGWLAQTLMGGQPIERMVRWQPATFTSYARSWWNLGAGGLGGEASETLRRFVPREPGYTSSMYPRTDLLLNPIRNTMPSWLPSNAYPWETTQAGFGDYFLDFSRGDPYCVSPDTLIEVDGGGLKPAAQVQAGDVITTHTGRHIEVVAAAVRPVEDGEKVFRIKVAGLTPFPLAVSEEHPILVLKTAGSYRRIYGDLKRVSLYEQANRVLAYYLSNPGATKIEVAAALGLRSSRLSAVLAQLAKDGKILMRNRRAPVVVLDPRPYDIQMIKKGLEWRPALKIRVGDYVAYPRPTKTEVITLDVADYLDPDEYVFTEKYAYLHERLEYAEAYEWVEAHGNPLFARGERKALLASRGWDARTFEHAQSAYRNGRCPTRIPRYITIDEDFATIAGYYVAEGSVDHGGVAFAFHRREVEYRAELDRCAPRLFGVRGTTYYRSRNGAVHRIGYIPLAHLLASLFGKGARNKHLPSWFILLPPNVLVAFLRALFNGDGCCFVSCGRRVIVSLTTTSMTLAYQVRQLLLKLGVVASIIERSPSVSTLRRDDGTEMTVNSGVGYTVRACGQNARALAALLGYELPEPPNDGARRAEAWLDESYVYMRVLSVEEVHEVKTVIGFQVDVDDSFVAAGVATHNTKIFRGEMRLPGPGYEALYGRPEIRLGPSYVNRSLGELVALLLGYRKPLTEFGEYATDIGERIHREYQRYWKKQGVLIGAEVPVEVPELGIKGYIDALLATSEGPMVVDIKSMSQERFEKALERGEPYEEHRRQIWMYQWMTGYTKTPGGLMYVSRDTGQEAWFEFPYNEQAVYEELAKFQLAREIAQRMVDRGLVSPYEAYPPLERYKILADTSPWSEERRYYEQLLSSMRDELSEQEWQEFQQAKREARERRRRLRVFPYRFRYADLQRETVTVARWLDANTFLTEEHPDQPMRFAGLYVPQAKDDEAAQAAAAYLAQELPPGTRITVGYVADPLRRHGQDQLKTLRVVVWKGLKNINRDLLERGLAKERERDDSPAGVHARFAPSQIWLGRLWERFAHLPSPFHSKLLPVRSPLEEYERRDLFGKKYQRWEHPIRDFVIPTLESIAAYPIPEAMLVGGLLGLFTLPFLRRQSPWRGLRYGALFGAALSLTRMGYEAITGETWIPARRRRERDAELYFQALEYLKYRGLYEYAKRKALEEEGIDVEAFFGRMRGRRRFTKAKREELLQEKRALLEEGRAENAERIAEINEELEELSGWRELIPLTPWFASALHYRQRYESTVWGADPYRSDYATLMRALPAKEREYFPYFVEAPPQERERIERIAPIYLRRFLQARWGKPVESLPSLEEFFRTHYLPPPDWEGWDVHHDLQDVKVKTLSREGFELSEFGYWEQDEKRAEYLKAPALPYNLPTERLQDLESRLRAILEGQGLADVQVQITPSSYPGVRVFADVIASRHDAIRDYVREHFAELVRR